MVRFTSENYNEDSEPKVNLISRLLSTTFLLASIYTVYKAVISEKISIIYIILITAILLVLNFVFGLIAFKRKTTRKTLVIYDIMSVIFMAGMIFSTTKLNQNTSNSDNVSENDGQYVVYSIITSSKSNIDTPAELDGKELFIYDEPEEKIDDSDLENAIKNVISDSTLTHKGNIDIVMNRAARLIDSGSIIKNDTYNSYITDNQDYKEQIRVIDEIKIKIK